MVTDAPNSPHRFVDRMRGEIYCGFAEKDQWAPPSTIETLAKLFKDRQQDVRYRAIVHPGTVHGYSLPDRDIYQQGRAPIAIGRTSLRCSSGSWSSLGDSAPNWLRRKSSRLPFWLLN